MALEADHNRIYSGGLECIEFDHLIQAGYNCLSCSSYKFKDFDRNTVGRKWKNDFLSKMYSLRIQPHINIVTAQGILFQKGFFKIGSDYSEEQHFTLHCIFKFTECIVHWGIGETQT
jgi:hypothetical protein